MWKIVVILVVLVIVALFVPRYDLMRRTATGSDEFELMQEGMWSRDKCHAKGQEFEYGFRCVKTSAWRTIMSNQRRLSQGPEIE